MKTLPKNIFRILMLVALVVALPHKTRAQEGGQISFQTFYDELQPYGTWIDDPNYGNVWIPDVGTDFRPYGSAGHWVLTDYGNTWVSDYDWGWAPFHYGRWRYDDYYGWEWIPGYEWGPAWVNWRTGGGFYGWAPLSPGININIGFGSYNPPENYWVFAPQAYINNPRIFNYYAPRTRVNTYIRQTTIINNVYVNNNTRYVAGPRREDIARVTHNNNVNVYHINNVYKPGATNITNNTVNIYRPAVNHGADARPARVVDANAYRNAHPNENIAGGHAGNNNAGNAARLATEARSTSNNTVRINARPNNGAIPAENRSNTPTPVPNTNTAGRPNNIAPAQSGQPGTATSNNFDRNRGSRPKGTPYQRNNPQPASPVINNGQPVNPAVNNAQQSQQQAEQAREQQRQQQASQQAQQNQQRQQRQQQASQQAQQNQQRQQQASQQAQQNQQRQQQASQQVQQNQQRQQGQHQRQQQQRQQRQPQPAQPQPPKPDGQPHP